MKGLFVDNGAKKLMLVFQSSGIIPENKWDDILNGKIEREDIKKMHKNYNFFSFKEKNTKYDYYFIEDEYNDFYGWYMFENGRFIIEELRDEIDCFIEEQPRKYEKVITFGSSKGGTGALLYGILCKNVTHVFSLVPIIKVLQYIKDHPLLGQAKYQKLIFPEDNFLVKKDLDRVFDDIMKFGPTNLENKKIFCYTGVVDQQVNDILYFKTKIEEESSAKMKIILNPKRENHTDLVTKNIDAIYELLFNDLSVNKECLFLLPDTSTYILVEETKSVTSRNEKEYYIEENGVKRLFEKDIFNFNYLIQTDEYNEKNFRKRAIHYFGNTILKDKHSKVKKIYILSGYENQRIIQADEYNESQKRVAVEHYEQDAILSSRNEKLKNVFYLDAEGNQTITYRLEYSRMKVIIVYTYFPQTKFVDRSKNIKYKHYLSGTSNNDVIYQEEFNIAGEKINTRYFYEGELRFDLVNSLDGYKNFIKRSEEENSTKELIKHSGALTQGRKSIAQNYFANTYYHVLVSIIYALEMEKKSRLYLSTEYVKFSSRFIEQLEKLKIFGEIIVYNNNGVVNKLMGALQQPHLEAGIVIPYYLNTYFANAFELLESNDTNYIFSDSMPNWYYLERNFKNFVKLEDAYDSFEREIKIHEFYGMWGSIGKYIPQYYPEVNYKSSKIESIIISKDIEDLSEPYRSKIEVIDTKKLIKKHNIKFNEIIEVLFNLSDLSDLLEIEKSNSVLLLTQPLSKLGYCSVDEQKELYRILLEKYKDRKIFIKPHPADDIQYEVEAAIILNRENPIEVYRYVDITFDTAITFGSTAIETIANVHEKIIVFKLKDFTRNDVKIRIEEIIKKGEV